MYAPGPTQEELDLLGISREDVEDTSSTDIWPENVNAFLVFDAMRTQWRVGMAGATGLDYAALPATLDLLDIEFDEDTTRKQLFSQLRVMEYEALSLMAQQRK
jgi:hypothetical protein